MTITIKIFCRSWNQCIQYLHCWICISGYVYKGLWIGLLEIYHSEWTVDCLLDIIITLHYINGHAMWIPINKMHISHIKTTNWKTKQLKNNQTCESVLEQLRHPPPGGGVLQPKLFHEMELYPNLLHKTESVYEENEILVQRRGPLNYIQNCISSDTNSCNGFACKHWSRSKFHRKTLQCKIIVWFCGC